jgi:hypothetical protein
VEATEYYKALLRTAGLNRLIQTHVFDVVSNKLDYSYPTFMVEEVGFKLMTRMVQQILEVKRRVALATTEADRDYYQGRVLEVEGQIDDLVYSLYGISDAERRIVEANSTARSSDDLANGRVDESDPADSVEGS